MTTEPQAGAEPGQYRGVIIIGWPASANAGSPYASMVARKTEIADALTGKPIRTCTGFTVHGDMDALVTADLTLLADADGEPLLEGKPVLKDGEVITGTFPFIVSEMRVQGDAGPKLAILRDAVQRVLDDEESGEGGWGPDVTMVTVLREAMEASA
jgi:hypothetical protein